MPEYCVSKNPQDNGDHEVHDVTAGMWCLPIALNRHSLGQFPSCQPAVEAAKERYRRVNGCRWCAFRCHTK